MEPKNIKIIKVGDFRRIYLAISEIRGLKLPPGSIFQVAGYTITNNHEFIAAQIKHKSEFRGVSGSHFVGGIYLGSTYILSNVIFEHEFKDDQSYFAANMHVHSKAMALIINLLWFIRDSSCFIRDVFFYREDPFDIHGSQLEYIYYGKAGRLTKTIIDSDDVKIWEKTIELYRILIGVDRKNEKAIDKTYYSDSFNSFVIDNINEINYNDTTRLDRAFLFSQLARSSSLPIIRITNFVASLESLFSTSGVEISHQVSERVALYYPLQRPRKAIYTFIKDCYDIRSKYIHGDDIDKKLYNQIMSISANLERICKKIFIKIATSDQATFKQDKKGMRDAFMNLLFP